MEAGVQLTSQTQGSQKPHFPTAEDWHGDQDIDEDIERHKAKVQCQKCQRLKIFDKKAAE